ncbi:MAG: NAD(P)/FAD-dependent oxidoreductase [Cytophagaceae bacterium]
MIFEKEFTVTPEVAGNEELLRAEILADIKAGTGKVNFRVKRRSIDARSRAVKVNLLVEVFVDENPPLEKFHKEYPDVRNNPQAIIIGAGPAGMFAALRLIEKGIKPIVFERGKDVRSRRRDLAAINKEHKVNPESNYCFGEGGAGTYSDGKLYTRSTKRGDVRAVLEALVAHGATSEILVDSHPHIGTNKLPVVVQNLRSTIIEHGGEVHFNSKVTDFIIDSDEIAGVEINHEEKVKGLAVILATGHSARDIYHLLYNKKIEIKAKPFAMGVRVEHSQQQIDSIQYHCTDRGPYLPASSYSLVNQVVYKGLQRGVFSFCMCPGGFIVPAATSQEEIVVNGMSPSRRDSQFANSGIVVAIEKEDFRKYSKFGELAGLEYQKNVEYDAWVAGGRTQTAPAQRLADFVSGKTSSGLLPTSYQPGIISVNMNEMLPEAISYRLRESFKVFGKKMRGYLTNEAQIIGVESRTSAPVMIPRDKERLEHLQIKRLFPCGEGGGYAGGIVSAAIDGQRCADAVAAIYGNTGI